ncbi:MAG: 4-(cytidine 5'-diphospho)-2-C-methyl-D-erythritol kinase [Candidatus Brocadiales bacterium]
MNTKKTISLTAPAKINLFLEVLGKRPDGYHELETVMQEIDLADTLTLEEVDRGIELTCTEPDIPCDEDNLVWKAARIFKEETGVEKGIRIHLVKRIPVAAGLGGGSSNAATMLKGLNTLWDTGLSETILMDMAAQLGSDVPFFIKGGTALCKGRGEIVTPLAVRHRFSYVLLYPDIRVSTANVYNNLKIDLTRDKKDVNFLCKALLSDNVSALNSSLFNRLEEVALELYPELRKFMGLLESYLSNGVLLSGSGSAIYGRCENREEAKNVIEDLNKRGIKRAFVVSNLLPSAPA